QFAFAAAFFPAAVSSFDVHLLFVGTGTVVVVVVLVVVVVVVVGGVHAPKLPMSCIGLLVGLGHASAKSFENIPVSMRVRLYVPSPGVSVSAGLPSGSAVPSYGP